MQIRYDLIVWILLGVDVACFVYGMVNHQRVVSKGGTVQFSWAPGPNVPETAYKDDRRAKIGYVGFFFITGLLTFLPRW